LAKSSQPAVRRNGSSQSLSGTKWSESRTKK
jgi:hypothetical protein